MTPVRKILVALAVVTAVSLGAVVAFMVYLQLSPPTRSAQTGAERIAAGRARLAKLNQAKGALLNSKVLSWINCAAHEGQAHGDAWRELSLNDKRAAVRALSGVCELETGFARVTIVDDRRGSTLGTFDPLRGVQVY